MASADEGNAGQMAAGRRIAGVTAETFFVFRGKIVRSLANIIMGGVTDVSVSSVLPFIDDSSGLGRRMTSQRVAETPNTRTRDLRCTKPRGSLA